MVNDRRRFLAATTALGIGTLGLSSGHARGDDKPKGDKRDQPEEDVGAAEDLMREHGVLNRILLVYEEGLRRLREKEEFTPDVFHKPATLVRKFVEDYHEKLEEKFIFPEFEKAKKLVDLVKVCVSSTRRAAKVTDVILRNAVPDQFRKEDARKELVRSCEAFIRMYRPHEAREDTVLFPALHKILPAKRLNELGEQFEKEEDRLFGEEGFEKTVDRSPRSRSSWASTTSPNLLPNDPPPRAAGGRGDRRRGHRLGERLRDRKPADPGAGGAGRHEAGRRRRLRPAPGGDRPALWAAAPYVDRRLLWSFGLMSTLPVWPGPGRCCTPTPTTRPSQWSSAGAPDLHPRDGPDGAFRKAAVQGLGGVGRRGRVRALGRARRQPGRHPVGGDARLRRAEACLRRHGHGGGPDRGRCTLAGLPRHPGAGGCSPVAVPAGGDGGGDHRHPGRRAVAAADPGAGLPPPRGGAGASPRRLHARSGR